MVRFSQERGTMDFLARFIQEHYLQLEEQEAAPVACGGESHIDGRVEGGQRLTLAQRERFIRALRRETNARGLSLGRFFQPFAGSVILRDGEPYWGRFWINGNY